MLWRTASSRLYRHLVLWKWIGGAYCLHLQGLGISQARNLLADFLCSFLAWLSFRTWRWRCYTASKWIPLRLFLQTAVLKRFNACNTLATEIRMRVSGRHPTEQIESNKNNLIERHNPDHLCLPWDAQPSAVCKYNWKGQRILCLLGEDVESLVLGLRDILT
jgi:hypothetical protein